MTQYITHNRQQLIMGKCTCNIPRLANYYIEVVISRNIPGGTETQDSYAYVCAKHAPCEDSVAEWWQKETGGAGNWEVIEVTRYQNLRD